MTDLVTLVQAKEQLRITDTDSDDELTRLVTASSAIVARYVGTSAVAWTSTSIPPDAQVAVFLVLAALYEDREGLDDPIGVGVMSLLATYRDPALA
jgi:hypothetical protein